MLHPKPWGDARGGGNFSAFWVAQWRCLRSRATGEDASNWVSQPHITSNERGSCARISPWPEGYVERENLSIEYRWAEGQFHRFPELAAELVQRQVDVIVTTGGPAPAMAAKAATTAIPIVFAVALDPVELGLFASLSPPEANLTGISIFNTELTAKRLALLRDLLPTATAWLR